ncbi:MAG: hypothetical protein EOP06_02875 [Proteobacteria bacterium]|nr:MAG: hypothetical protein EOP06_02875 [Pseudomonadota bacterium]
MGDDIQDHGFYIAEFLDRYVQLIEGELLDVRKNMIATIEEIMQSVLASSQVTERKRKDAAEIMEKIYLTPSESEMARSDIVQDLVSAIIEQHDKGIPEEVVLDFPLKEHEFGLTAKSLFDALESIDHHFKEATSFVTARSMEAMGALSREDLITQKLQHIRLSLSALETGLRYLLIDHERKLPRDEIERVIKEITHYTYRQYTSEDEKVRFARLFGIPKT